MVRLHPRLGLFKLNSTVDFTGTIVLAVAILVVDGKHHHGGQLGGVFHPRFPDQPTQKDSGDSVLAGCSSILRYTTSGEVPIFSDIEINH